MALDALGNWTEFKEDATDGGTWDLDQDRSHNEANEITSITDGASHWIDPEYDAAGNTTEVPVPGDEANHYYILTYDAWNRLVSVYDDESSAVAEFEYDGLGRRIEKTDKTGASDVTYDYYYNGSWQVVEVRKDGAGYFYKQYVWDVRYVDAPVCRLHDSDNDGSGIATQYYTTDANFNVTALVGN